MKILILNWKDIKNPKAGGAEVVTHQYAKRLVREGHQVTLVSPAYPGCKKEEIIAAIRIKRLGLKTQFNFIFNYFLSFIFYQKHFKGKVDLVIDQIHWLPFFTPLYVKEKKLAFIHEVAQDIWLRQFGPILGSIGKLIEPLFFLPYRKTQFLTVSSTTKKDLEKFGILGKNITVIPNGIAEKPLKNPPKKTKNITLLSFGRIAKVKNIEDTIYTFSIVCKKYSNAKLIITGKVDDKKYYNALKNLARKKRIEKKVDFLGYLSEKEKRKLLARSHLLIHTSVAEGWGLNIIEANACGTPAVVYDVPGLSESVVDQKTGLVSKENNPEDLARLIFQILEDGKKYKKIQHEALKWASNFSWEKSYQEFCKLLT